jgi:Leucine-rich repeat (LRR) protein
MPPRATQGTVPTSAANIPLSSMHQLIFLGLTFNNLTDISPISELTNLTEIQLRTNHVADISALSNLNKLNRIDMTQNQIADLSPLVADTGFATGDTVWITENPLSAQSINTYIPQLQARGAAVIH